MDWQQLAERCEQACGPDRALDYEIHCRNGMQGVGMYGAHPKYTASIDAALTLVPEGWGFQIMPLMAVLRHPKNTGMDCEAYGKTPALAICAAALKAMNQGGE